MNGACMENSCVCVMAFKIRVYIQTDSQGEEKEAINLTRNGIHGHFPGLESICRSMTYQKNKMFQRNSLCCIILYERATVSFRVGNIIGSKLT